MRLSDLKMHCDALNLNPTPTRNRVNKETGERYLDFQIKDYMKALQDYYVNKRKLEGTYHKSLDYIMNTLNMESPMLALQIKNKPKELQDEIWNNQDKWLAEEKIDGCRLNLCWFKEDKSLDAYSRNTSDLDFLPKSYGEKLYDTVNIDSFSIIPNFVLDGELVLNSKEVDKGDGSIIADTQLNMVSAILTADYELSKEFQRLNPIKLIVFDILMYDNKDLTNLPLRERKKYLNIIFDKIKDKINVELVPNSQGLTTREFYNQVVSVGGEGLVVKDLDSKYDLKGKRAGEWIKIKRSVTETMLEAKFGDTLDAFVIGYTRGNGRNENLVGSILFGIYLLDNNNQLILNEDGSPYIHEIAQVGGLEDALRQAISVYIPETNEVKLRADVYGKVAEVTGQDISSKQLRLMHPVLVQWRMDKTPMNCSIRKDFLEKLVL